MFILSALLLTAILVEGHPTTIERRLHNGVGVKPAMGWNTWNSGLPPTAANALAQAHAFVSLGLKDLGYIYVNMDDTWSQKTRSSSGQLVPNPAYFPDGVKNLTDQIHALGLKFGLYGDSGTATCSGFPGSAGYEKADAATLAAWGVDYWKYDNCNVQVAGNSSVRYSTMRDALLAQSHPILYSLCNWGADAVWEWGANVGNSWRVGGDITNNWNSIASIATNNAALAPYAQPGGFNDFDMMEIGNHVLTEAEERAHFGLWAISKSPLLLGTDLTKIAASSLAIIKNKGVIAVNQDSLGIAASAFQPASQPSSNSQLPQYWAGPLSDGHVIGLVAANGAQTLSVSFADVPGLNKSTTYSYTELYTGKSGSGTSVSIALAGHDMAVFKVTNASKT